MAGDVLDGDDHGGNIGQMGEKEISVEFEKMLENMNLTEEKKEPLRRIPLNKKREMLTMNSKTVARVSCLKLNYFSLKTEIFRIASTHRPTTFSFCQIPSCLYPKSPAASSLYELR